MTLKLGEWEGDKIYMLSPHSVRQPSEIDDAQMTHATALQAARRRAMSSSDGKVDAKVGANSKSSKAALAEMTQRSEL